MRIPESADVDVGRSIVIPVPVTSESRVKPLQYNKLRIMTAGFGSLPIIRASRRNSLPRSGMRHIVKLCRLFGRHAVSALKIKRCALFAKLCRLFGRHAITLFLPVSCGDRRGSGYAGVTRKWMQEKWMWLGVLFCGGPLVRARWLAAFCAVRRSQLPVQRIMRGVGVPAAGRSGCGEVINRRHETCVELSRRVIDRSLQVWAVRIGLAGVGELVSF